MERKLKIGVFGGKRGNVMMEVLLHHTEAELVAVCDKYEPLLVEAKAKAEKLGINIQCFNNFDDFIKCDMDAVVLANFATEHATFAIRCLNAGKHVMSEVLPSQTIAQAVELIETVEKTGLVYTYAENYCYMDTTFEMWRRYKNGDVGEVEYCECDYIHDCESRWLELTYGDVNHWRNHLCPTFYCTHSIGPILAITDRRPVQVVGFENPPIEGFYNLGHAGGHGSGIEMLTLDNGAIVKSIHGPLKHKLQTTYKVFGKNGSIENVDEDIRTYIENGEPCQGEVNVYKPDSDISKDIKEKTGITSHGGSDFYATHFFIEKILGHEDGKWALDVYKAVDMGICGIQAFRSILGGNVPVKIPDLRDKAQRDLYRNDNFCTDKKVAGDMVVPCSAYPERVITEKQSSELRQRWLDTQKPKA